MSCLSSVKQVSLGWNQFSHNSENSDLESTIAITIWGSIGVSSLFLPALLTAQTCSCLQPYKSLPPNSELHKSSCGLSDEIT